MFNNPIWKKGSNKAHKIMDGVGITPTVAKNEDIVKILFGIVSKNDKKTEIAIKTGNRNIRQLNNNLGKALEDSITKALTRKGIEQDVENAVKKGGEQGILSLKERKLEPKELIKRLINKNLFSLSKFPELATEQSKVIDGFQNSPGSQPLTEPGRFQTLSMGYLVLDKFKIILKKNNL